jgi:hypothetical protein
MLLNPVLPAVRGREAFNARSPRPTRGGGGRVLEPRNYLRISPPKHNFSFSELYQLTNYK